MNNIGPMLTQIATVCGILCMFAALLLYAFSKVSDSQGGRGEGAMISCVVASIACFGAAAFISTQNLQISF